MSTLSTTNLKNPSSGSNNIVLAADGSATITTLTGTTITGTSVRGGITSGTAIASTSGTSIDFTSIPSYVKRITVMLNGVSTSGTSNLLVQLGTSSGIVSSGYNSTSIGLQVSPLAGGGNSSAAGYIVQADTSSATRSGHLIATVISSNIWVSSHSIKFSSTQLAFGGGDITLSGTLDRLRITTVSGTDTFDAGSINIAYEG